MPILCCVIFSGFVDIYHLLFERARSQGLYSASLLNVPASVRWKCLPPVYS